MPFQVTHIRLSNTFSDSAESIEKVKLSSGTIETVAEVVKRIDYGYEYFYTQVDGSKALIETVHPIGGDPYIRTKANKTTKDNLLSLPEF